MAVVADAPTSGVHELKTLVLSRHPVISVETDEEQRAAELIRSVAAELRLPLYEWSVTRGLARGPGAVYGSGDPQKVLGEIAALDLEALFLLKDFAPHLASPFAVRELRDLAERFSRPGRLSTLIVTGTSFSLPRDLEAVVVPFHLAPPVRSEYRRTVSTVLRSLEESGQVRVELGADDLDRVCAAVAGMTLNQARQAVAHAAIEDGRLGPEDVEGVVHRKAEMLRQDGLLEYFPAADNSHELGGFERLTGWLERARVGFTDEAADLGLTPPRGLMLVGVQGCGKSLAAKVIARRWTMPLLKLDAGRLFDKFIGESEKNFRRAIAMAESMAPVVLWIDEIEKGLAPTSAGESDGGLSRRLFGSFLTWMQEKRADVFVVATANDLSALPPELLRKGRFDEIFFVDLPRADEREQILSIHLRLRRQDPASFDLDRLTEATEGFSGAEIEQAVISALYGALHRGGPLETDGLVAEIAATVPLSVSRREDIEHLRETARGRFVPVR